MSLLSLLNKCRDDAELEEVMTSISCNCIVYLVTCKRNIEWFVDNLVVCMTEDSVGKLIDEYVGNMNRLETFLSTNFLINAFVISIQITLFLVLIQAY